MNRTHTTSDHGNAGVKPKCETKAAPKWAILLNDGLFPMPRQKLKARTILDQSGCGNNLILVRDHNSRNDVIFKHYDSVDLSEGNVFRTIPRGETNDHQDPCVEPAKLAFVIEDAWEVTLNAKQTGQSLKELLGLSQEVELFRDFEAPEDEPVQNRDVILFGDGPVFTLKRKGRPTYCINIEGTKHSWPEPTITTVQIRELGNLPKDQQVVVENAEGTERTLGELEVITLDPCCRFGRAPKYKRG